VNYHLDYPNRIDLEDYCGIDLSVKRNQECLKLWQSFSCTTSCPEYGHPARYERICFADWYRLREVCNTPLAFFGQGDKREVSQPQYTLYDCLAEGAGENFDWVDEDDTDCYPITPDLIPASDRFEHDYCFYGDPDRCNAQDCLLEERNTVGYFGPRENCDCCGPNGDPYGNVILETAPAPICLSSYLDPYAGIISYIAIFHDITRPESGEGRECLQIAYKSDHLKYGIIDGSAECNYAIGQCAVVAVYVEFLATVPPPSFCNSPTGAQDVNQNGIPSEIYCLYGQGGG
jgi:hypothetical protein